MAMSSASEQNKNMKGVSSRRCDGERVRVRLLGIHDDGADRAEQYEQHTQAVLDLHRFVQIVCGGDRAAHERGGRERDDHGLQRVVELQRHDVEQRAHDAVDEEAKQPDPGLVHNIVHDRCFVELDLDSKAM